jgi:transcription-repair coupling factor (superfamily II helicase)
VGRSHHQAFAYLITPPREALQGDARKRLEALEALDDLGAGFVLATHDLEIRGAGELSAKQSGQIQEIASPLQRDAEPDGARCKTVSTGPSPGDANPTSAARAGAAARGVPPDVHLRLVLYKRIANASSDAELQALSGEITDHFGPCRRRLPTCYAFQRCACAREAGVPASRPAPAARGISSRRPLAWIRRAS